MVVNIVNHKYLYDANTITKLITSIVSEDTACRNLGLHCLITTLKDCSVHLLEKNASSYLAFLMKTWNKRDIELYGTLIFEAIALLIQKLQVSPNLSKNILPLHVSKICNSLELINYNANSIFIISGLHAANQCLKYCPGSCKSSKASLQSFLVKLVDSSDPDIVYQTGKCWSLLHQIHFNDNISENPQNFQYRELQLKLLGSLHQLLSVTFTNYNEALDDVLDVVLVNIKYDYFALDLLDDPIQCAERGCRRFCNIVEFLKIVLRQCLLPLKFIYSKKILTLIQCGLKVIHINLKSKTKLDMWFTSVLFQVQAKLLELLESLIEICHTHMRIHFRLILGLLLDSLKCIKLFPAKKQMLMDLRSKFYGVATLWALSLKEGSHCEIIAEFIVQQIFEDVLLQKLDLPLTKSMPKRAQECLKPQHRVSKEIADESNQKKRALCTQALHCLQAIFMAVGHLLKPSIVKNIHSNILEICTRFYDFPLKDKLYANYRYREEVLKILVIIITTPVHLCPPPSELCLNILKLSNLSRHNYDIRIKYQTLINGVENSVHPQKVPLEIIANPFNDSINERTSNLNELAFIGNEKEQINQYISEPPLGNMEVTKDHLNTSLVLPIEITQNKNSDCSLEPCEVTIDKPILQSNRLLISDKNQLGSIENICISDDKDTKFIDELSAIFIDELH